VTLRPIVQLRIGGSDILTIPPNNLISFKYTDNVEITDNVIFSFVDPTMGDLEDLIMDADKRYGATVMFRWGYPDNGLDKAKWRSMDFVDYLPDILPGRLMITLTGNAYNLNTNISRVKPTVYKGKISSVMKQIAADMGYTDSSKIFIEETDDDYRDGTEDADIPVTNPLNISTKSVWPTNNLDIIDFVNLMLLPTAKSKANPQGIYSFKIGTNQTFHFHTQFYKANDSNDTTSIRTFNLLYAVQDNSIRFQPEYSSSLMGSYARSVVATSYDPRLKQFIKKTLDRNTVNLSTSLDPKSAKTTAPPLVDSNDEDARSKKTNFYSHYPTRQVALGGRCAGKTTRKYNEPEEAIKMSERSFMRMQRYVSAATLFLTGADADLVNFDADERWCIVNVIKQNKSLHWSSGKYNIQQIIHDVGSKYDITVKLLRYTHADGPADAKTGKSSASQKTIKVI
jgi:hypothetical protein